MKGKNKLIIFELIAIAIFLIFILVLNQLISYKNKKDEIENKLTNETNSAKCLNGLKEFKSDQIAMEMCIPNNWSIDNNRSSSNEIVFDTGDFESIESIKVDKVVKTLDQWSDSIDKEIIISKRNIKIDNTEAIEINTSDFGVSYVGFIKNNKFYIITTNGGMDDSIINTIQIK